MVYITIIAEEEVICKRCGHWYEDDEEWSKTIHRHIFVFNPLNEELLCDYRRTYMIKDWFIGIKLFETITGEIDLRGKHSYESSTVGRITTYKSQYVDEENSEKFCKYMNHDLDFLLYIPCLFVDPCTVGPKRVFQNYNSSHIECRDAYYLPTPTCRISNYENCEMVEKSPQDFEGISPFEIKSKQRKYILCEHKSWNMIRREMVDKYLSGEIIPDDDEIEMYERFVDEVKWEDYLSEKELEE